MSSVLRIVFLVILYWESAWPHHLCCNWIKSTHLPKTRPADSILILQTEVLFCMHRFLGTKGIFRACDAASVPQDTELSRRDVFSYFLHHERIQTDHTFCVKVEDLTCGRRNYLLYLPVLCITCCWFLWNVINCWEFTDILAEDSEWWCELFYTPTAVYF